MGSKSRGNWLISKCLRECRNKNSPLCNECVNSRFYEPIKEIKDDREKVQRGSRGV